ncbi:MAG: 50S ribosomal protein L5 [Gemmatimonadetes bacterium]|nr:50S ribosomal protein L5 [Gemmatimonadota bacterium]
MVTRLQEYYENEVVSVLIQKFGYKNRMQVPKLEKVVLNMGVGEAVLNAKVIENAVEDLTRIAGQRPSIRRARKAVSNFKLRQGVPIGCAVTLRRSRMYEFLDRFFNFSVPRIRDFRGLSMRSFDGRGLYSICIQ